MQAFFGFATYHLFLSSLPQTAYSCSIILAPNPAYILQKKKKNQIPMLSPAKTLFLVFFFKPL